MRRLLSQCTKPGRVRLFSTFGQCRDQLPTSGHAFVSLQKIGDDRVATLPVCIRLFLESAIRNCDGVAVTERDIQAILDHKNTAGKADFNWLPPRVILQDLSGIPVLVDLCAMRDAVKARGGDPKRVNPLSRVDLVVDHSVIVDVSRTPDALAKNMQIEFERNKERFEFLKWAQKSFSSCSVVPPGAGIVHQVHCEVSVRDGVAHPDGCVGTDSHTPMVNGVGVVAWGVGGIEAEAAMLGQPMSLVLPEVVGVHLKGGLAPGVTATDVVLTVTQLLRQHNCVGKFVEFYGQGAASLSVTDRMTVANMCPEYGATCGLFPVDEHTLHYLKTTGRSEEQVQLIEEYYRANGMFGSSDNEGVHYNSVLELDLSTITPCLAGPKRPQDKVALPDLQKDFSSALTQPRGFKGFGLTDEQAKQTAEADGRTITHGALAIAAITSCTNTSNPSVLMAAGLVAKKAVELGLVTPGYVKTSLAPGSRVVTQYLQDSGLSGYLDQLGFQTVGYGCTTCMGNSGEVDTEMQKASEDGIVTAAILSGNRNFEGRVHLSVKAAYLASPPMVVAGALAGTIDLDWENDPIGQGTNGPVYLRDVWPAPEEVSEYVAKYVTPSVFKSVYGQNHESDAWAALKVDEGVTYPWDPASTYITKPPFVEDSQSPIGEARCLLLLGDSVTTDHISPVSSIKNGPAFEYLKSKGVAPKDMASFGSRRANADVMVRGTFANPRIVNKMVDEGGPLAYHLPSNEVMHVFEASEKYRSTGTDLVVVAGKEYGTGSSRDWAAKGTAMLGVRAVLAESFERIHRSNLVGMGVLPIIFDGVEANNLTGWETYRLDIGESLTPLQEVGITVTRDGKEWSFKGVVRLDTEVEVQYWKHGGILPYVLETF